MDRESNPHFTARRGFIAAAGFGMAVHTAPRRERGSRSSACSRNASSSSTGSKTAACGRGRVPSAMPAEHAGHGAHAPTPSTAAVANGGEPVDVYLMAYQFGFAPGVLRLEAGVPYRFRMMAVDVAHGASVRVGPGARITRLRPGALVEQELTFQRAGEHLLYRTVYCGLAHDRMQGRIIVAERGDGS